MKKLLFFSIFICLIFGTNNYQELNNISIITNIGIEKENNIYNVIYQEVIPIKSDNKLENKYKYYKVNGNSLDDCFKKIDEIISKNIYYDHLENIIINIDEKEVIGKLNKYFKDDQDSFYLVFTNKRVEKIIKYSNNYKYINSIIKKDINYRKYKKETMENDKVRIPVITIKENNLVFYKYENLGDKND